MTKRAKKLRPQLESLESKTLFAVDIVSLAPAADASNVDPAENLQIVFAEEVQLGPGTGNITILNADDGSVLEIISAASDQVSIDGATVTIDPSSDLPANTNFAVSVDSSAFLGSSGGSQDASLLTEDFENLPLEDSPLAEDDIVFDVNDYVVTMKGVLDVQVAGEYTFGVNSDDGQNLAVDVAQDGFDFFEDEIIFDNNNHGNQDRLHVCGLDDPVQSCEGDSLEDPVTLAVGEYEFEYRYYERGGGSSGEFYYAPGLQEIFNASEFAIVGDASKGIGVTAAGIEVTTYKADGIQIGDLTSAEGLIEGFDVAEGFPASETYEFADVYNTGGRGRFRVDNPLPGFPAPEEGDDTDWTATPPQGWVQDNSEMPTLPGPDGEVGTDDDERPVDEYFGWNFLDKFWWINQQGNQSRTDFTKGEGTLAVVDPDAYDDFGLDIGDGQPPESSTFDAELESPMISLVGVAENSASVKFDSSWWDENYQSAELRVEFFDAAGASLGENLLFRWESADYQGDLYKEAARNETVEEELSNPANAASMIITWDMPEAGNDWWWAIDNIEVNAQVDNNVSDETTWFFNTFSAPVIGFAATEVSAAEGAEATFTVERQGDTSAALSVSYATEAGTATASDFTQASGTVDFAEGETSKTISVAFADDDAAELNETVIVTLSNPTGGAVLGEATATATIVDNDRPSMVLQEGVEITIAGEGTGVTYTGTTDADPAGQAPDGERNSASLNPDGSDGGSPVHGLTKFDNLFDNLPEDAVVTGGTLTFDIFNPGTPLTMHRMLSDWDQETITWNDLMFNGNTDPGLQGDGVEATQSLRQFSAPAEIVSIDVTEDILAWQSGEAENYGWGFLPTGTDGVDWNSAEAASPTSRPKLAIEFVIPTDEPVAPTPDPVSVGDINDDGEVSFADFLILSAAFGSDVDPFTNGDVDGTGNVAFADFLVLSSNFGKSVDEIFASLG